MGFTDSEIIDIELQSPKKKFRINGDNTKIIELNPSDVNIVSRLRETYKKLDALAAEAGSLLADQEEVTTEEDLEKVSNALTKLDKEMRDLIDYLFDGSVSSVIAENINLYSPVNGQFWFEHCIEVLSNLYSNNFQSEFKKMQARINKHTDKYTRKV